MKHPNSPRLCFTILLLSFSFFSFSQKGHNTKPWKAKVYIDGVKFKGILSDVTDSSVILYHYSNPTDEILFADIDKIKLVPDHGRGSKRLIGFVAGSIAGAWALSTHMTKGKEGEPAALSGIIGGIGGGIIGASIGAGVAPSVYNLFAKKTFKLQHDNESHRLLKLKLQRYSINVR